MKFIGDILSLLVGSFLFKLTEILLERYKRQVLSFFIFITEVFFCFIVIFFVLFVITIVRTGINSGFPVIALIITIPTGILLCRLLRRIIKWLKMARSEA